MLGDANEKVSEKNDLVEAGDSDEDQEMMDDKNDADGNKGEENTFQHIKEEKQRKRELKQVYDAATEKQKKDRNRRVKDEKNDDGNGNEEVQDKMLKEEEEIVEQEDKKNKEKEPSEFIDQKKRSKGLVVGKSGEKVEEDEEGKQGIEPDSDQENVNTMGASRGI